MDPARRPSLPYGFGKRPVQRAKFGPNPESGPGRLVAAIATGCGWRLVDLDAFADEVVGGGFDTRSENFHEFIDLVPRQRQRG